MTFRPKRLLFWWLTTGALALLSVLGSPGTAWARNQSSLRFSRVASLQRAQWDLDGSVHLRPGLSPDGFTDAAVNPCQALWSSRLAASQSLERAEQLAADAQACPRETLVRRWAGQLAWQAGNLAAARSQWGKLPPLSLVTWGHNLVLMGEVGIGKAVLLTAESQQPVQTLARWLQAQLYQTLGDVARKDGNLQDAIVDYEKAWLALDHNYGNVAYQLGEAYRSLGDCRGAIEVWETSLQNKPERNFPGLDFSYLVSLAGCQIQLNKLDRAHFYIDAAQAMIEDQRASLSSEATARLRERLDRVKNGLQGQSSP